MSSGVSSRRLASRDFLELTKPRITLLVMLTSLVGFIMGSVGPVNGRLLLASVIGTGLVAGGASTLNMLLERRTDALMLRTRERPLPAGRLTPGEALAWGLTLTVAGTLMLAYLCGLLAAAVAIMTWVTYLFLYTPLKPVSSLNTVAGALPGALPPVIGWAAARGALDPGAFLLFAILFLWQIPHFLAIAWIYRDDYARGGMQMLPVVDSTGRLTARQVVANSVGLLLVSLSPTMAGLAGWIYLAGAVLLGLAMLAAAVQLARQRTMAAGRLLFFVSILYLPALSGLLLFDRL
jgi:protoheme IX farnesyltransferase